MFRHQGGTAMRAFADLRIRTKIIVIVCIAALGMAAALGIGLYDLRATMQDGRGIKTKHIVETALSVVKRYEEIGRAHV